MRDERTIKLLGLTTGQVMIEKQSPYLAHQHRLADVIAAIQVMGTYRYSGRKVESWANLLGEKPKSANDWQSIFNEHPEFFRAGIGDDDFQSLVVRRAQPRVYNTQTEEVITVEQFKALPKDNRSHISRLPLSSEQILALIDVAVKLQTQAVVRRKELRWWVPVVIGVLSSLVGVFVGAAIKGG
ncbi:N-carbamoyl-L-amino acid amidohydrolase [Pseudoalteromonas sp. Scap03]|uniref:N-carbamoyl-L-amino acid amidohydrolase n=2 Tax=Gammaproteobacteria TaxID=1236 RepID=UPI0015BE810C|nr:MULTISPECIES: N-carbamoyl-L-amino acid amidohydrolase [unclassified Pseudoalteromonas]NWL17351.1 N-carbamoyl-L-amino acid amidohydrolase [Pseudoalteromonas sp. Scap03]QLE83392.1 N-carbamoyl-L-amino acid amidohydrolase [Pseudoalteromonas sp. Scap25]